MTINFAVTFLAGLIIYRIYDLPLPSDTNLGLTLMAAVVWAAGYVFLWICRHYPLAGWFLFGFLSGLLGGGRRRRW
jgi:hypothetical protein